MERPWRNWLNVLGIREKNFCESDKYFGKCRNKLQKYYKILSNYLKNAIYMV